MNTRMAAIGLAAALAACGGDDADGAGPLVDFVFVEPDGFAELVRGDTVDVTWDVTTAPGLELRLDVLPGGDPTTPLPLRWTDLAPGTLAWDGTVQGARLLAGHFELRATALTSGEEVLQHVDGGAQHLIVLQGVRFRDQTLAFTGAQANRELVLTTVTRSVMEMTLALDPDTGADGDELPLLTASIPGELVPTTRSYPFTGRTAADDAIAAGTYTLIAQVRARGGANTYVDYGPQLTWAP
jgi:hypothetical protein